MGYHYLIVLATNGMVSIIPITNTNQDIETVLRGWISKQEIEIPNDVTSLMLMFCRDDQKDISDAAKMEHDEYFNQCYEQAVVFIKDQFDKRMLDTSRPLFYHVTCMTDRSIVEKVMWDCQNVVVRSGLKYGGLLW